MPDSQDNPKPAETLVDQYDLGDDSPASPAVPAPETAPPTETPRNPDGTFAPRSKHTAATRQLASELGYPEDVIEESSPEALQVALALSAKLQLLKQRENRSAEASFRGAVEGQAPAPAQPPTPTDETFWGIGEDGKPVSADHYLPEFASVIKQMQGEIKALQRQVMQVHGVQQEGIRHSVAARLDDVFNKLKMVHLFGEGRGLEMDEKSAELYRRRKVIEEAGRMAGPKATLAQQLAAIPEVIKLLYPTTAAQAPATPPEEKTRTMEELWREASLARPTQRVPQPGKAGPAKAATSVAAKLQEMRGSNGVLENEDDEPI